MCKYTSDNDDDNLKFKSNMEANGLVLVNEAHSYSYGQYYYSALNWKRNICGGGGEARQCRWLVSSSSQFPPQCNAPSPQAPK